MDQVKRIRRAQEAANREMSLLSLACARIGEFSQDGGSLSELDSLLRIASRQIRRVWRELEKVKGKENQDA